MLTGIRTQLVYTSVPHRFEKKYVEVCSEKIKWEWDGVDFSFLSPSPLSSLRGNNASCVLKVNNGKQSILLTGDIEKQAEDFLQKKHRSELPATILLAPHHGSKTSSSNAFLDSVAPDYVIFSTGFLNQYHHPHKGVINRYKMRGVKMLNTVSSGAITMTLLPDFGKVIIDEYRRSHKKIWHNSF